MIVNRAARAARAGRVAHACTLLLLALTSAACATAPGAAHPTVRPDAVIGGTAAAASSDSVLRVISYNIHAGKDAGQQHNLERVARLILDAQADVVLLQEVDRNTQRSGGEDHLAELSRLTGMEAAFAKSLDYQGGHYGIGLLSRLPIVRSEVLPLPVVPPQDRSGSTHEPRVGLYAVLGAAGGTHLHVVNTHIDSGRDPTYRHQEVIRLLSHIARHVPPDAPLIFGGDLNARPDTPEIGALSLIFRDAWSECGDGGPGYSFPAHAPDRRIDYILLRNVRCGMARVIESEASDHRPVFSTVRF